MMPPMPPMPPEIKVADNRALMTERRNLLEVQRPWTDRGEPFKETIVPWEPAKTRERFLSRFYELTT